MPLSPIEMGKQGRVEDRTGATKRRTRKFVDEEVRPAVIAKARIAALRMKAIPIATAIRERRRANAMAATNSTKTSGSSHFATGLPKAYAVRAWRN